MVAFLPDFYIFLIFLIVKFQSDRLAFARRFIVRLFLYFCILIQAMTIDQTFYIGYISKTRGLKGEVQLFFEFEDYMDLDFDVLFLEVNKKLVPYFVDTLKMHNNSTAYATFEDIDHIDKAQPLIRKKMYLPLDQKPERDPDDFRYTDLVGYVAIEEEEGELGEITQVQEMPQQFIATVDMDGTEVMFPLNENFIVGIDPEEQVVVLRLPEGLIDMYFEQ